METALIAQKTRDSFLNLIADTLDKKKQALVFVNTKKSAEKQAEDIAKYIKKGNEAQNELARKILGVLSQPTHQCARLAGCIRAGTAFHHSGLHPRQRELIEDNFRDGNIRIICATPTLAAGVDLPAYRSIIKDLKRFDGNYGMVPIPILEYQQMIGRAGRPSFDNVGEGICIAKSESEKDEIYRRYVLGAPEEIYSKLAAEPALRMYLLSLLAGDFVSSKVEIMNFFKKTFWAHQYRDLGELQNILEQQLANLEGWLFVKKVGGPRSSDFVSADEVGNEVYKATSLGMRVSELYLDPLTAHGFVTSLDRAREVTLTPFGCVHLICTTKEMFPLLHVKTKEWDTIAQKSLEHMPNLLVSEPSLYDPDYEEFLDADKTACMFHDWMEENTEQYLLDTYDVRPGETRNKLDIAQWLFRCLIEMGRVLNTDKKILSEINRARIRLKNGVKDELVPLVKFRNIGRVRARKLFANKIQSIADVKRVDLTMLRQLVGLKVALSLKEQVGEKTPDIPKQGKRKGQFGLARFDTGF